MEEFFENELARKFEEMIENNDELYFDTEEYGLLSSGSEIFTESVVDYFGEIERARLLEVKTKKGKTYKAVPVLGKSKKEETTNNDLPF